MAELGKSVLKGEGITKVFGYGKTRTTAVDHVDFDFREGEVISIVGESGSGKSVSAMSILKLFESNQKIYEGEIYYNRMEYEFEIDASTGTIIEWSAEHWD